MFLLSGKYSCNNGVMRTCCMNMYLNVLLLEGTPYLVYGLLASCEVELFRFLQHEIVLINISVIVFYDLDLKYSKWTRSFR